MRMVAGISTMILAFLTLPLGSARADELIDEIDKAWRERGSKVKTLSADWSCEVFIPIGGQSEVQKNLDAIREFSRRLDKTVVVNKHPVVPQKETRLAITGKLRFAPDRVLISREKIEWSPAKEEFLVLGNMCGYSEGKITRLYSNGSISTSFPDAQIFSGSGNPDMNMDELWPFSLCFLPHASGTRLFELSKYIKSPTKAESANMIEIVAEVSVGPSFVVWVDPKRDMIPVFVRLLRGNKKAVELSIEYGQNSIMRWEPTRWKLSRFQENGSLSERLDCTMKTIEVNSSIGADEFEVRMPHGTVLITREGKNESFSIVDKNGQLKSIPLETLGQPHEQLLEAADASATPKTRRAFWLSLMAIAIVFCVMASWRLIQRKRKTR